MAKIQKIWAREILDSRGNPTVRCYVELDDGTRAEASVPSGASTGVFEAHELRDGDENRYGGKGVLGAVENINGELASKIVGMEATEQQNIDDTMRQLDGTENKSRLGANAILGVSLAVCRAAAKSQKKPLYIYIAETFNFENPSKKTFSIPMFNVLNGGKHADSGLSVQEFKIVPVGISSYLEQLRAGAEIFHALAGLLTEAGHSTAVGDEGGFAPRVASHEEAFEYMVRATQKAGYTLGTEIVFDIDAAADSFYDASQNKYILEPEGKTLAREEMMEVYRSWREKFPLLSLEDGLHEEDWEGWPVFMETMHKEFPEMLFVGDDHLVTNVERLEKAIEKKSCNSVLIKPNQIGTLSETIDCIALAKKNNMKTILSHRSGETTDTFIADLTIGVSSEFIKTGSLSRGERMCKYNRMLEIYDELI